MFDFIIKGFCFLGWIEYNGNCYFFSEIVVNFIIVEVCFIVIGCYMSINIFQLIFYMYVKKCLMQVICKFLESVFVEFILVENNVFLGNYINSIGLQIFIIK